LTSHEIKLSDTQLAQIHEIFDLFDTDGGGSIDRRELELALVALGFQKEGPAKPSPGKMLLKGSSSVDSIVQDGTVSRAEFRYKCCN
jgi:Ca2+-binding EF-hand superfamily protein